ncbi:regulator of length of O-antigen component of lipopolysaccharide chains [Morganella morganii IS15]|nr:regulator of length of O-antigen component of lipopolysaccharide chains [Morganella morganii IS15]
MRSENTPDPQQTQYDQELDIRALFMSLWRGKLWIAGMAVVFALVALGASYFMQQKWNSTAITDYPTVNNLGGYYSQQQFMRNLDTHLNAAQESSALLPIPNEAYQEFITQRHLMIPAVISGYRRITTSPAWKMMPKQMRHCWTK